MGRTQFAVFASGRGSNFSAIYDQIHSGSIDGDIVCVLSNNKDAQVLEKARQWGIETLHQNTSHYATVAEFSSVLVHSMHERNVDYILLAGYMKKIPADFLRAFPQKVVNIHPALLPAFGGKGFYGERVHQAVIERGVKWSGVTVHFVDEIYDHGPIIFQWPVRVGDEDNAETLAAHILEYEHKAYPKVVRWLSKDWIQIQKNRTIYSGPEEEWILE